MFSTYAISMILASHFHKDIYYSFVQIPNPRFWDISGFVLSNIQESGISLWSILIIFSIETNCAWDSNLVTLIIQCSKPWIHAGLVVVFEGTHSFTSEQTGESFTSTKSLNSLQSDTFSHFHNKSIFSLRKLVVRRGISIFNTLAEHVS